MRIRLARHALKGQREKKTFMKRFLITVIVTTAVMPGFVALAIPSSGTIQTYQYGAPQGYADGGEFYCYIDGDTSTVALNTWCIEINNTFVPGDVYNYTLGQTTHGDPSIGGPSSPLQLGTAWLFAQWNAGAFGNVNAGEFQAALWYFQNQGPQPSAYAAWNNGDPNADVYTADAIAALGSAASSDSNGAYGVDVLEMENGQDFLATAPDGGTTVMLLGAGLSVIGLLRRKLIA